MSLSQSACIYANSCGRWLDLSSFFEGRHAGCSTAAPSLDSVGGYTGIHGRPRIPAQEQDLARQELLLLPSLRCVCCRSSCSKKALARHYFAALAPLQSLPCISCVSSSESQTGAALEHPACFLRRRNREAKPNRFPQYEHSPWLFPCAWQTSVKKSGHLLLNSPGLKHNLVRTCPVLFLRPQR